MIFNHWIIIVVNNLVFRPKVQYFSDMPDGVSNTRFFVVYTFCQNS